ncbi:hypothetical protein SAMN06265222_1235 [Neorhodopirellula lusitana]|uniref:Uncharacterized protein n=1 Tax=Neorhodopirellula lusitana TaxID=445327 RepID=A0ABY1QQA2_9BACT|nr:hypothetical protein SAMN06265222_1235 [Neorhodopirellula lusitana]
MHCVHRPRFEFESWRTISKLSTQPGNLWVIELRAMHMKDRVSTLVTCGRGCKHTIERLPGLNRHLFVLKLFRKPLNSLELWIVMRNLKKLRVSVNPLLRVVTKLHAAIDRCIVAGDGHRTSRCRDEVISHRYLRLNAHRAAVKVVNQLAAS